MGMKLGAWHGTTTKTLILPWAVAGMMTLAGCGSDPPPGTTPPPPEVLVTPVQRRPVPMQQEVPGRLQAHRTAQLRARVDGILKQRHFQEGDEVTAGTLLYQLDDRPLLANLQAAEAALARAEADLTLASQTLDRQRQLQTSHVGSRQDLDQAIAQRTREEAAVAAAKAALELARIDLDYAAVTAPIPGRIGRTQVTEGTLVSKSAATHLATIEQLDPIWANFTQSSLELLRRQQAIRQGLATTSPKVEVQLLLEDNTLYPHPGRWSFTDAAVNPQTGSVALRAEFPNPDRILLPGAFVRIRFVPAIADHALVVPQAAVLSSPRGPTVLTLDAQNRVVSRPVQTGGFTGADWILRSGVQEGELVIASGVQKARPGTVVAPKLLADQGSK